MKKTFRAAGALCMLAIVFTSCQKSSHTDDAVDPTTLSLDEKSLIVAAGFNGNWAHKTSDGHYIIENDILLTKAELQEMSGVTPTNNIIVANEEHYRTNNLVTTPATGQRTITVRLGSGFPAYYSTGLDQALARYNSYNLKIRFQRVTSGGDIVISSANLGGSSSSCVLGQASGFPSGGNPSPGFVMSNSPCALASTNTAAKADEVMAHEIGHCIGFRHTNYTTRNNCPASNRGNEGAGTEGAVHIPGTPTSANTSASDASWMMACVNGSPAFTAADGVALNYVY